MTTLELLRAVDALLSDESKWTRRTWASGPEGDCSPKDPRAERFCLAGAGWAVRGARDGALVLTGTLAPLFGALPSGTQVLADWNDDPTRKFADIKALLACAIAAEAG